MAQAIYDQSSGRGDFVHANGVTLAAGRFEVELFGETPRTGRRGRPTPLPGLWEQASGGTLYLEELDGLSLPQQAMLNEALRSGEFRPCGGKPRPVPDAKLILSSASDLGALTRSGRFLADLYYRLRQFTIHLPPLRDRPEDIPLLVHSLWSELAGSKAHPVPAPVVALLQSYPWPGNARELKSVLVSLHTLFGKARLTPEHVRGLMAEQGFPAPASCDQKPEQQADRMRCVRHLLRAEELLLSLQHVLRPAAGRRRPAHRSPSSGQSLETVGRLLAELELLFFNPSSFGSVAVYTLMNAVKGKVHYYHDLLTSGSASAKAFLSGDLAPGLAETLGGLRRETARLLNLE